MWEIELLEIQKKLLAKIKIQCFEFKGYKLFQNEENVLYAVLIDQLFL